MSKNTPATKNQALAEQLMNMRLSQINDKVAQEYVPLINVGMYTSHKVSRDLVSWRFTSFNFMGLRMISKKELEGYAIKMGWDWSDARVSLIDESVIANVGDRRLNELIESNAIIRVMDAAKISARVKGPASSTISHHINKICIGTHTYFLAGEFYSFLTNRLANNDPVNHWELEKGYDAPFKLNPRFIENDIVFTGKITTHALCYIDEWICFWSERGAFLEKSATVNEKYQSNPDDKVHVVDLTQNFHNTLGGMFPTPPFVVDLDAEWNVCIVVFNASVPDFAQRWGEYNNIEVFDFHEFGFKKHDENKKVLVTCPNWRKPSMRQKVYGIADANKNINVVIARQKEDTL